jgi:putative transposase
MMSPGRYDSMSDSVRKVLQIRLSASLQNRVRHEWSWYAGDVDITHVGREHTMTKGKRKADIIELKELLAQDEDFLRVAVQASVQAALEAEMTQTIGAEKGERTETRLTYRSGYYTRSLITRVGTLELRVPQDRDERFSTELFQRYQRSEKALVGTLAEMYVQGVSTRKVKAVTEALCGHSFSASAISAVNKSLDEALRAFAERRLSEPFPYLILDARYEMVREAGIII